VGLRQPSCFWALYTLRDRSEVEVEVEGMTARLSVQGAMFGRGGSDRTCDETSASRFTSRLSGPGEVFTGVPVHDGRATAGSEMMCIDPAYLHFGYIRDCGSTSPVSEGGQKDVGVLGEITFFRIS
jgi:hypothetical protein